jgi:dipeptidyl aminopeptidase/acylaminoacyl peptidase
LLTGKANANGTAYNEELVAKSLSTARVYDQIYVRHWDTWLTPQTYALFSGTLTGKSKKTFGGTLNNLLKGVQGLETPVQPSGGTGDFAITPDGKTVALLSKAPELPQANYTASYIYLVPHDGSSVAKPVNAPKSKGTPKTARGASAAPIFSPDGKALAYLQMDEVDYESDRNKLYSTKIGSGVITAIAHNWDRSPSAVSYSTDGTTFLIQAEEYGRTKIFSLPTSADSKATPKAVTEEGSVSSFYQISTDSLLVSNSSLVQSTGFAVVSSAGGKAPKVLLDPRKLDSQLSGLEYNQIEEFWYAGNWTKIHGWIIKPIGFDRTKKYPLAFLVCKKLLHSQIFLTFKLIIADSWWPSRLMGKFLEPAVEPRSLGQSRLRGDCVGQP